MAQAGTTIDLQQQATGSGRKMGFWLAFLAVAVALAIGLAVAATQLNIGSSGTAPIDRSYDQVEQLRGGASISNGVQVGPDDRGLDGPKKHAGGPVTTVTPNAGYNPESYHGSGVDTSVTPTGPTVQQFKHAPGRGPLQ
jgi:hypothetical protein